MERSSDAIRLIAMLSWFDEEPELLCECVGSMAVANVTDLVAVDGGYALLPGAHARSPRVQISALRDACHHHGIELMLYQPRTVWVGNEVSKRVVMLALAGKVARSGDWLFVLDADYLIRDAPPRLPKLLSTVAEDVCSVSFYDSIHVNGDPAIYPANLLMRWRGAGVSMGSNHYTYVLPSGCSTILGGWGHTALIHELSEVLVQHRKWQRDTKRLDRQRMYYEAREKMGIEA